MELWRTSSYSGPSNNCVEVGLAVESVAVRDTKDRDGGRLAVTPARWQSFLAALRHGTYDR